MTTTTFVGRTHQLARLDAFLDRALAGHGQVCFVTGDAGAGKTTLAAEFLRRAEARHADLVAAVAMGDPQTGVSDPYLIFREVLTLLTGNVEAQVAQGAITQEGAQRLQAAMRTSIDCLIEYGPDLIGLFVPGAGLAIQLAKIGIDVTKRAGLVDRLTQAPAAQADAVGPKSLDQGQIFEQYARVLKALSQYAPLLLILDDLQWADVSSIDLLFHLVRRIESSRIFIIALYRPAEIALGREGQRHPLERVVTEIKRYYGDVIIDLDEAARQEGPAFIADLLDSEPNHLGPGFRKALYERTGGNPLFAVELLRDLEEEGHLVRDDAGQLVEGSQLNWSTLPARAEGVIESRINRLTADLLEALKLASVQGDAFTAEVVAQIRDMNSRDFVRQLSNDLEKRHRLVASQGQQRVGEQRLSQYQFQNRLFQQYLYAALDPTERAYLHEDIGRALEALYGDRADEVAMRLAWHFAEAGVPDKARYYLQRAGEQAAERFAYAEAVDFFTRALTFTPPEEPTNRFVMLLGRVKACDRLGRRELQGQDVVELERLAEGLGRPKELTEAAYQRATYEEACHNYEAAAASCERCVAWAQQAGDVEQEVQGRLLWSAILNRQGDFQAALTQAEQARTQAAAAGLSQWMADALLAMGKYEHNLGNTADEHSHLAEAQQLYRRLGNRRGEGKAAEQLAWLALDEGNYLESRHLDEFALAVNREIGDRRGEIVVLNNLGGLLVATGDLAGAQAHFEQALSIAAEIGERLVEGAAHVNLSAIQRMAGNYDRALAEAETAHAIFEDIQSPYGKSHSWLRRGMALAGLGRLDEALAAYESAIAVHQVLGNSILGLEPQAGVARVRLAQGDAAQALVDLQPLLDHLAAGHDFDGTEEPLWMHLTCYEVLRANHDPQAEDILARAYHQLMERAARFGDASARRMFLTNIPQHRQIVIAYTGEDPLPATLPATTPTPSETPAPPPNDAAATVTMAAAPAPSPAPAGVPPPAAPPGPAAAAAPSAPAAQPDLRPAWRRPGLIRGVLIGAASLVLLTALVLLLRFALAGRADCLPTCAGADLAGHQWQGRELVGVVFDGSQLYGAHFAEADLTAATLVSATLAAADLSGARLRGADLRNANLRGANLHEADLTSADLRGAVLIGADLTHATLTDADLRGANLAAAVLDDSILLDIRFDEATRWPHGFTWPASP